MKHDRGKFNVGYSGTPDSDKAYRENFDIAFGKGDASEAQESAKAEE